MELQTSITQSVIIAPIGGKVTERKLNAVALATHASALTVIAARGGKVGKVAAERNVGAALVDMAHHCANSNYRPLAEVLASMTGKTTVVDRHVFHALPALYKAEMQDLESRGKAISATTGKAAAAYTQAAALYKMTSELVEASERIRAERKAEADAKARDAEIARLLENMDATEEALAAE